MSKYRTCAFFVDNVRCLWCPVSGHINRSSTLSEVFVGKTIDYRDAAYWKDIVKAKQAFLAGDQAAAEGRVRPLVLESWKRCLPFLGTKLAKKRTCLEQSALTHVMQQNRELLACAIPVIEYLNTILGSSSTVVLLTSGDGVLLHKHVGTKSRAAAALLSLGMLMGEEYEGTTSTALCLREQSVVELFGAEHLIREEEDLCCISAPIFGGKRRMLGVLTIALPLELYHLHTSGMVLMAAKDISDQHHLHDLLSDQEAILEQVDTGIVVLDKNGGIKAANCTGRSMLHISPPPAPLGNINDVLGSAESLLMMIQSRKNIRDRECFFNLTDGGSLQCMLSAAPIPNDKGMVLFLIIAATNKRLQQSVRDGSFREDLFYRLSVLTIDVPPLRERQQDVMLLAESFLRAGVQAIHKPCRGFSAEVAEIFSRYPWPGNVRELENIVERSLNIARGDTIEREDLPLSLLEREDEDLGGRNRWQAAPAPGNVPAAVLPGRDTGRGGTLQSREVEILLDVLKANGGNMRKTAQELGIARSALYAKLHRMGIDIAALRSGR